MNGHQVHLAGLDWSRIRAADGLSPGRQRIFTVAEAYELQAARRHMPAFDAQISIYDGGLIPRRLPELIDAGVAPRAAG